ncbi:transglutaminase-like cysteine peptidase [Phenylobacterium sp.]|uniref:transglutaminase-like cysteine peptidase n=1 Tax=Phenylobacterium sp. TaxID=1871053 RepID=UPI002F9475EC
MSLQISAPSLTETSSIAPAVVSALPPAGEAAGVLQTSGSAAAAPQSPRESLPVLSNELWASLNRVNASVNRAIVRRTDLEAYGVDEIWNTPIELGLKYGDCEDYVLEKRRALLAAGVPREALSIAVVTTARGESHAVLLVETQSGAYVLDNLSPWVMPWASTAYVWRERQVAGSSQHWAWAEPTPAAASFLLAAAR